MEKKNIETFIEKYNLNGLIEEVRWISDSKSRTLKTCATTSDRKFMAFVEMSDVDGIPDAEICVIDTSKMKQMLNPLSSEISIELDIDDENNKKRVRTIIFSDKDVKADITAGAPDVVRESPKIKLLPESDVEIILTDGFIEKFLKSKSALTEAELFTLTMNKSKNKLEMILGYSENNNTNRIALGVPTVDNKDKINSPISFSAKVLKEVILANREIKNPVFKVSEQGLAHMEFSGDKFNSKYYFIKIPVED